MINTTLYYFRFCLCLCSEDVKSNKSTRLLLAGESGIGKSALLDEVCRRIIDEGENERNRSFVGYYSKRTHYSSM